MKDTGHAKLLADCKKRYSKSKPRIAHYVAQNINKEDIPQQFIDVISHISKKKIT
ncbi:MAG: hypothetical protein JSW28_05735 [Thermoplasmata archaeon]|nr:MAG: hypothetical protein JSW28_05735 [Thermoplasmata archaeon]